MATFFNAGIGARPLRGPPMSDQGAGVFSFGLPNIDRHFGFFSHAAKSKFPINGDRRGLGTISTALAALNRHLGFFSRVGEMADRKCLAWPDDGGRDNLYHVRRHRPGICCTKTVNRLDAFRVADVPPLRASRCPKIHLGPVTAKLCRSAKGARATGMDLGTTRLRTESTIGKELELKTVARAAILTGSREQLDLQSAKFPAYAAVAT